LWRTAFEAVASTNSATPANGAELVDPQT
jgi:hypothetical protein